MQVRPLQQGNKVLVLSLVYRRPVLHLEVYLEHEVHARDTVRKEDEASIQQLEERIVKRKELRAQQLEERAKVKILAKIQILSFPGDLIRKHIWLTGVYCIY